jgi:hypothetical protein
MVNAIAADFHIAQRVVKSRMTIKTIHAQSVSPPYSATNAGIHDEPDRVAKAEKMANGTSSK